MIGKPANEAATELCLAALSTRSIAHSDHCKSTETYVRYYGLMGV